MSHQSEMPTAQDDPRINLHDSYLFAGVPGTTIMVMTVNSGAGLSAPDARIEFAQRVAKVVRNIATQEELVADPAGRANHVVGRLFPTVLSFELGSRTGRTVSGFNGRALDDDVMGMIPALPTGTLLSADATPPAKWMRPDFPYFGAPYSASEQEGVASARPTPQPA